MVSAQSGISKYIINKEMDPSGKYTVKSLSNYLIASDLIKKS